MLKKKFKNDLVICIPKNNTNKSLFIQIGQLLNVYPTTNSARNDQPHLFEGRSPCVFKDFP